MGEKEFRNKVSWMMFLFSILVIWVHAYNVDLFARGGTGSFWTCADRMERFLSESLGQIAVPGFFMISACLFFRGFSWSWEKLARKWKGRLFSVGVPYVVWNLLYYLGYAAASRLPGIQKVVGKGTIPFTLAEMAAAVLEYRYAPIFWYLFQLILLILLSPVIYLVIRKRLAGAVYLGLLVLAVHFHIDTQHPNTDALLYYSFAAYVMVHKRDLLEERWKKRHGVTGILFLAAAVFCFWNMGKPGADVLWTVFYRLLVPAAFWMILDAERLSQTRPWMRQSLFLYAIHYIVVRFVNKAAAIVLGHVLEAEGMAFASVGIYLALPVIVVFISYILALFLERWMPHVWKVLSGGRKLGAG